MSFDFRYLTSDQMIQYIGDIEFEAKVLLARIFSNLTKDEQDSLSFSTQVSQVKNN